MPIGKEPEGDCGKTKDDCRNSIQDKYSGWSFDKVEKKVFECSKCVCEDC